MSEKSRRLPSPHFVRSRAPFATLALFWLVTVVRSISFFCLPPFSKLRAQGREKKGRALATTTHARRNRFFLVTMRGAGERREAFSYLEKHNNNTSEKKERDLQQSARAPAYTHRNGRNGVRSQRTRGSYAH